MLLAALLLLVATLSHDQLRENLGALGAPLADLFHFLVMFSLFMYLLERLSARTVANVAVAALAAVLVLVVINSGGGATTGSGAELSSISTIFSLPFLLEIVEHDGLTLQILNFMQVYLTFAVMAISHAAGRRAGARDLPAPRESLDQGPARRVAGILLAAIPVVGHGDRQSRISAGRRDCTERPGSSKSPGTPTSCCWPRCRPGRSSRSSVSPARRHSRLFNGLYEEPLNFLGVGLFLTLFIAVFHLFGLSVMAFSLIFLAFAEEYSKHLIVRFTDDDSIHSINDSIEFSIIVGLAFAFAENVLLYFPRLLAAGDMPALLLRSVLTVLMHAVASGILGYFYGLAHFSAEEVRRGHGGRGPMYRLLHRVFLFRRERLYHEAKMFEGLILAGAYHATFNLAANQGRVGVMLALVGGGCAFLYYLLGLKSNREKIGAISAKRVHETFVGRLRRRST